MMGEVPTPRTPEPDATLLTPLRDLERGARLRVALLETIHRGEPVVHGHQRGEACAIGPRAVALEGVPDRRHLPFELELGQGTFGQAKFERGTGGFDEGVRRQLPCDRGVPEPGIGAGFHSLSVPAWRRVPGVLLLPVLPLRTRLGDLVPRMVGRERIADRIGRKVLALPAARPLLVG